MIKRTAFAFLTIALSVTCVVGKSAGKPAADTTPKPPFGGTIFVCRDIITDEDPSAFKSVVAAGRKEVGMFDRRLTKQRKFNAYIFTASFDDGQKMEVRVNPEFGADEAMVQARKYLYYIGQMPFVLRRDVAKVLIHKGRKPFGGGGGGVLIHTGMGESYIKSGILSETLYHEASHTSLDRRHSTSKGWLEAQKADGGFISGYAKSHPRREDVAETYLMYFAVRYRPHRIDDKLKAKIVKAVPHRIAYFDSLGSKMFPVKPAGALARLSTTEVQAELKLTDAQKAAIKTLGQQRTAAFKKQKPRKAKIGELNSQFDKKALALLTPDQKETLQSLMKTPKTPTPAGKSK